MNLFSANITNDSPDFFDYFSVRNIIFSFESTLTIRNKSALFRRTNKITIKPILCNSLCNIDRR